MLTTAAILVETGRPLEIVDLEIPKLQPGQVLVEVAYSGVCHTQVLEARGYRGEDKFLPHCLGHEGTGRVVEIGAGVTKVSADDEVVLSWIKGSGLNVPGTKYSFDGKACNAGGVTTFQRHAVVSENRLTQMPADVPLDVAALLGCAVPTGAGVVWNTCAPRPGQSLCLFGAGGVGLCAIAAAAVNGCHPLIAVDLQEDKLKIAKQLGATHTINGGDKDIVDQIRAIVPGGVDFAVEATGRPDVMKTAIEVVRQQGGVAAIVGNARFGESLSIDPGQLNQGKQIRGTWGGDSVPDRDIPRFAQLLSAGRLPISNLLSSPYSLESINDAIDDLEHGRAVRPLIAVQQGA